MFNSLLITQSGNFTLCSYQSICIRNFFFFFTNLNSNFVSCTFLKTPLCNYNNYNNHGCFPENYNLKPLKSIIIYSPYHHFFFHLYLIYHYSSNCKPLRWVVLKSCIGWNLVATIIVILFNGFLCFRGYNGWCQYWDFDTFKALF